MKTIILVAVLAMAIAAPIKFEKDSHEGSSLGVFTRGFFDPTASGESKIESFLRLANELIPLAEVKGQAEEPQGQKLGYYKKFCTGVDGQLFNACFFASAELWIGWTVAQNGTVGSYDVTYTPFTFLRAGANVSVESYPAEVGYGGYVSFVNIQIPIFALLGQTQICYSGNFNFAPGSFYTQISTALLECGWCFTPYCFEGCNKVFGPNFQHLTYTLWNGYQTAFLASNCIALPTF
jgi:hypothetical protein